MPQETNDINPLEARKKQLEVQKKRIKLLIGVGLAFLALFLVILYASFRKGGVSNLTKGDEDAVTNVVKNIGTSFNGSNATPTPTMFLTPLDFGGSSKNLDEVTLKNTDNNMTFSSTNSDYQLTIKVGTIVHFFNQTGTPIGLKFSDGRTVRLSDGEEQTVKFLKAGDLTFSDQLDTTRDRIRGAIYVK